MPIKLLLYSLQVGKFGEEMLHLLESWNVGGPLRRPWCVLEAAKCPIADTGFVRWSRAQILRLNSDEGRRWETRFASWP